MHLCAAAVLLCGAIFSWSCVDRREVQLIDPAYFRVEPAPDWTALLERDSGWFAADGVFSIPLNGRDRGCEDDDKEILLIFSDTYTGTLTNHRPDDGATMVNNSVALLRGCVPDAQKAEFYINRNELGQPAAFFSPQQQDERQEYFWLGDGFVHSGSNILYIFAYHIESTGPNVFDFIEPDISLLAIPGPVKPPFAGTRVLPTPLHVTHDRWGEGNFGAGVFVNTTWAGAQRPDGFIYVYGCIGADKSLVVARAPEQAFEDFDSWQYLADDGWATDSERLASLTNAVSNELSVSELPDGRYLLVFQVMGLSERVGCRIGNSPVGPWSDMIELYTTPESSQGLFTYNAKAHRHCHVQESF